MKGLLKAVEDLKKTEIKELVDIRIQEFKELGKKPINKIFNELCFCILTANSTAERCISVQENMKNGFLKLKEAELAENLKKYSCRFHTKRASYILEARKHLRELNKVLNQDSQEAREWLVNNIKGLGYKESSHFLRNIGFDDVAIIDFHILDLLEKYGIIKTPKNLNKKTYLEIEQKLREIAGNAGLSLAELDLYLWYIETKKVLK